MIILSLGIIASNVGEAWNFVYAYVVSHPRKSQLQSLRKKERAYQWRTRDYSHFYCGVLIECGCFLLILSKSSRKLTSALQTCTPPEVGRISLSVTVILLILIF